MINLKNLAWLGLMFTLCCPVVAQEKVESDDDRQLVESLIEASITNAAAIESGDVLWISSVFFDSTDFENYNRPNKMNPDAFQPGKLLASKTWNRLIFDHTKNRFFYIRRTEIKLDDFHDDKNEPVLKVNWTGIVHDEKNGITHWTSRPGSKSSKPLLDEKGDVSPPVMPIPDLRVASDASTLSLANFVSGMRKFESSGSLKNLEMTDKSYVVLFEWNDDGIDYESSDNLKRRSYSEIRFDLNYLQKTSLTSWVINAQGEKLQGVTRKTKWADFNGLFVPVETSDESATRRLVYGEPTFGVEENRSRYHWFSVNKGVDHAKVFDGEPFESLEAFDRMLDSIETNATNLIK